MPSPLTHGALPTLCLWTVTKSWPEFSKKEKIKLFVASVLLGNACDLDFVPAILLFPDRWNDIHRALGHNIFSVFFLSYCGAFLIRQFVSCKISKKVSLFISFFLVSSHVIFDASCDLDQFGDRPFVPLFWPVSDWKLILPFRFFKCPHVDFSELPILSHLSSPNLILTLIYEAYYSLLIFGTWYLLVKMTSFVRQLYESKKAYLARQ